jgi:hypothetical protein
MRVDFKLEGPALGFDSTEVVNLINLAKQGRDEVAVLVRQLMDAWNIEEPFKTGVVEAVASVFTSQIDRVRENDQGHGISMVMPWHWLMLGFFWFFEIHPRPGISEQSDWRWCAKCEGMFFSGGQATAGTCPAGGPHEKTFSGNYTLVHNVPAFIGQQDWRWCQKCYGLFFSCGVESVGTCPAGGAHGNRSSSGNYALAHNAPDAPGQSDWRWCHKCQGLYHSGGGETSGRCPAGNSHEKTVSGNYTVSHVAA